MTYLSTEQVAEELDRTPVMIRKYIQSGELKAERFGKRQWIISRADLEEFKRTIPRKPGWPKGRKRT